MKKELNLPLQIELMALDQGEMLVHGLEGKLILMTGLLFYGPGSVALEVSARDGFFIFLDFSDGGGGA